MLVQKKALHAQGFFVFMPHFYVGEASFLALPQYFQ
jgi:hypothetical protein